MKTYNLVKIDSKRKIVEGRRCKTIVSCQGFQYKNCIKIGSHYEFEFNKGHLKRVINNNHLK